MSDQPEALRLADVLDAHQFDEPHAAAACLRRQHAEIERLYAQRASVVDDYEKAPDWSLLEATQGALREHMAEIHKLRAERDALLVALKLIAATDLVDAALDPERAARIAYAAIPKAEGGGNG